MRKISLSKYGVPDFFIDPLAEEKYGPDFWDSVENGSWEKEQLRDLTSSAYYTSHFLDIGALNGVYSLVMASLGRNVIAVEPDNLQFRALVTNVELNQNLKIRARRGLVVSTVGPTLSPYALDTKSNNVDTLEKIDIVSLLYPEIDSTIKIDIEGGEWSLLSDKKVMRSLLQHKHLFVYLSPHIGFFSQNYHAGAIERFRFRLSVLKEFRTLYRFARKATSIVYLGVETTPFNKLLRQDRVLGGPGLRSHIVFEFYR
jgi:FkbM family methyltransferase